jgi:phosphoesterase RecJ-like protein
MQDKIKELVGAAQSIVILQADNPDADSLGSALALEHILGGIGKEIQLYCGVDIPTYLRYLPGWDRVQKDLPKQFDLSIIVDASTYTLFEQLDKTGQFAWLKSKPSIILDHHAQVEKPLDFAKVLLCDVHKSSTGELIFDLAKHCEWPVRAEAAEHIMSAILGDTQGLMNELTNANTYRAMAKLTEAGANRPRLEELRRESSKMAQEIYHYKGRLLERTEFAADGAIAYVTIPQDEINEYSPLYNPAVLMQFDSLQVIGVKISIVFKVYDDGHLTAKIRCASGAPIGAKLAEHFGGGGHPYASGFKITDGRSFSEIRSECLAYTTELLNNLAQEES